MESLSYEVKNEAKVRQALESLVEDKERRLFGGRGIVNLLPTSNGVSIELEDGSSVSVEITSDKKVEVFLGAQTQRELDELKGAVDRFLGQKLGYKP